MRSDRDTGGGSVSGLAFWSRVLAEERGDGTGVSDLLWERALHVFDGRVSSSLQQELHDVGELTRRRFERRDKQRVLLGIEENMFVIITNVDLPGDSFIVIYRDSY